ncbi:carboxylate-amine ligase [Thermomonospora cellulosilytica]|uniref:Putative glutamate--cysteine ligase 2 n=1 Tax=Thermomonospora cellulosilytica TaxID=1411118 RepID=A0A7W3RBJ3_9ACTN|nr:glutamate--cysteine ligase [Thermomonospora cellulosilytica]MBA9007067.1 carboxylate-amine ligase [Thermomonospora cellulosilytica]
MRSFGVEEELLIVDPDDGVPRAMSGAVLRCAERQGPEGLRHAGAPWSLDKELQREQVEFCTRPCTSLDDLADQIRQGRLAAARAARRAGVEIAALATSPVAVRPSLTPKARYHRMAEQYARTADEQLICGCHVHVEISSPEEGVGVLDRIRPWLAPLLALSGNSPFWQGRDTGYESWRQQVWWGWPSSGPTALFGSVRAYRDTVQAMIATGVLLDEGMVYFDARLSRHYPTVEIRVADVCLVAEDTVLVAALIRGLVETAARAWRAGEPPDPVRTEVLRPAMWRAARSGLRGPLVHPVTWRLAPAETVIEALVEHVRTALETAGDLKRVQRSLQSLRTRGTGAHLQRTAYADGGRPAEVVRDAITRTLCFP